LSCFDLLLGDRQSAVENVLN